MDDVASRGKRRWASIDSWSSRTTSRLGTPSAGTTPGWAGRVSEAGTVAEGLTKLDVEPEPCFLILDLMLPDGDGIAVLEAVRQKGLRTLVAVCTGSVDLARLKAVAELRPDAMFPKPIRMPNEWTETCRVCEAREARTSEQDA